VCMGFVILSSKIVADCGSIWIMDCDGYVMWFRGTGKCFVIVAIMIMIDDPVVVVEWVGREENTKNGHPSASPLSPFSPNNPSFLTNPNSPE
jgi:hypothetical protein